MKLKVSIVVLLIMSFLNMGYYCDILSYIDSFYNLENNVQEKSDFVENAVKVEYKTKNNIYSEKEKIEKNFSDFKLKRDDSNLVNHLIFYKDKQSVEVKLWEKEGYSYINIIMLNKDSRYTTMDLKKILDKIGDNNLVLNDCYSYYKGKTNENIIKELNDDGILKNSNLIKINNGYTGVADLNTGEKINFAQIKYNTGSYIIIATPIIFTTY